jgi:hypothetical protein
MYSIGEGIVGEKGLLVNAEERWRDTPRLAFAEDRTADLPSVDAYLAALATPEGCPVYSKNVTELEGQGESVANPLPGALGQLRPWLLAHC